MATNYTPADLEKIRKEQDELFMAIMNKHRITTARKFSQMPKRKDFDQIMNDLRKAFEPYKSMDLSQFYKGGCNP